MCGSVCECNVVNATLSQRYLEFTFLRCDNVAFTTLPQPKNNVVTKLSQYDVVCLVLGRHMSTENLLRRHLSTQ